MFLQAAFHPAAVGGAGVQRDDAGAVIGAEIRVRPELGAAVLIDGMAIGAMPVAAEDRLFLQAGLGRVHAVTPPRPAPFRLRGLPPVGAIAAAAVCLLKAGDPAVHEDIALGLVVLPGRGDDLSVIGRVLRRGGKGQIVLQGLRLVIAGQLQGRPIGSVAHMVPDRQALVDGDQLLIEVLMIPAHQDHRVFIHKLQDETLHRDGLLSAVKDIPQDNQLVGLRVGEIPRLIQRPVKLGIKAVNIGGDVVFHRFCPIVLMPLTSAAPRLTGRFPPDRLRIVLKRCDLIRHGDDGALQRVGRLAPGEGPHMPGNRVLCLLRELAHQLAGGLHGIRWMLSEAFLLGTIFLLPAQNPQIMAERAGDHGGNIGGDMQFSQRIAQAQAGESDVHGVIAHRGQLVMLLLKGPAHLLGTQDLIAIELQIFLCSLLVRFVPVSFDWQGSILPRILFDGYYSTDSE